MESYGICLLVSDLLHLACLQAYVNQFLFPDPSRSPSEDGEDYFCQNQAISCHKSLITLVFQIVNHSPIPLVFPQGPSHQHLPPALINCSLIQFAFLSSSFLISCWEKCNREEGLQYGININSQGRLFLISSNHPLLYTHDHR